MSESDSDEFYDAQDVTPSRSSVTVSRCETEGREDSVEEVASLSGTEREKQLLLEQKRTIEEKMRQEEEEIQQKLEALELKQMKEQQKQETARKAIEIEQRRKKLEGVREIMEQESTPVRSRTAAVPAEPCSNADNPETKDSHLTAEQQLEEKLEALSFELERSGQCIAVPCSRGSSSSDGLESNGRGDFSEDADHFISVNSRGFEGHSLDHLMSGFSSEIGHCFNKSSSLNGNLNRHEQSVQKVTCKQLEDLMTPEPVQPKCSSLPVQLSAYPCDGSRQESVRYQEPDIIQSTKSLSWQQPVTSTPIRDEPQSTDAGGAAVSETCLRQEGGGDVGGGDTPVAPPRKKKSSKSCESLPSAIRQVFPATNRLDISDDVDDDTHLTLDLCSAVQGNCHVTATDDAEAKGLEGLDLEVPCDADAISQGASSTQSDDNMEVQAEKEVKEQNTDRSVPSTSELCLARTKSKTLGGSPVHVIPPKPPAAKVLTDKEILEQVMVTNLDTGEKLPLSLAEEKVPKTTNPLALHIMRRTKEYSSESPMQKGKENAGKGSKEQGKTVKTIQLQKKRGKRLKKFLSKSVRKIKSELKSVKDDMFHGENSSSDEDEFVDGRRMIKIKASHSHKGPYDFDLLVPVQNLVEDSNAAVWTMKFSHCGKLLATGGQDNILRVWVLKSWYTYFDGMRQKYSEAASTTSAQPDVSADNTEEDHHAPFMRKPFCVYRGHTADLLDVSWSKNYFILSSSMDKTVRLWHVSRSECLCCFQHIDFVTAIAFHPKDDRYFLSGSLDGKLRLWSIPEKKVALWNEVSGQSKLITSANFCSDGKIAVGTYDGRCVLYTADHLDYHTQIHVRSTRGKNAKGGKITGVEPYPGENKILVTSNDSRIRLYDLRDKTLTCKYKGTINSSSRIKAVFNHDGRYIICGSEDGCVYIWKTQHDFYKFYSVRRDRNDFWEGVKAHVAVVTAAIFAPCPNLIIRPQFEYMDSEDRQTPGVRGEVIISADINGAIKVFINKFKPGSG